MSRTNKVFTHLFAWSAFTALFCVAVRFNISSDPIIWIVDFALSIVSWAGVFYPTALFIVPSYRQNGDQFRVLLLVLALLLAYLLFWYIFYYEFMVWLSGETDIYGVTELDAWFYQQVWWFSFFGLLGWGYGKAKQSIAIEKEKQVLIKEKMNLERSLLKSQFNPHFLYNALSYIYAKSSKYSDEIAEAVLLLSDIMRYNINKIEEGKVPLEKEVEHIKNFIKMHQMRFDNELNIHLCINGDLQGRAILPLIMISLVENALKHGDMSDVTSPLIVQLCVDPKQISFFVKNKKANNKKVSHRLGVDNLKQRLEIEHGKNHEFIIEDTNLFYSSKLTIYE